MADVARVVSLGSILVDLTVDVPVLPERGGDVLASATRTRAGGGFNVAAAVARQGVPCLYGAPSGSGPYGELVRRELLEEGIAFAPIPRADGDTGFCVVLVEPDGERTFVTMAGVEAAVSRAELDALGVSADDVVSISGYDLLYPGSGPVLAEWVYSGAARTVVLDPGPLILEIPPERWSSVLSRVSVLSLNQREARLRADAPGASGAELLAAMRRQIPDSVLLIVREGPDGCQAVGGPLGERVISVPAPAVEAIDSTGAGDAHTGILLAELARGTGIEAALELANRAAAISVTRLGPATAPRRRELIGPVQAE